MTVQEPAGAAAQPEALEECRAALAAAQHEAATQRENYLRAAAAIENARKQAERDAAARATQRLRATFLRLLEVADNLERTLDYAADDHPLAQGVRATLQQLRDVLRREGVVPIEVQAGTAFDPLYHEAVESYLAEVPETMVAEVRQTGYTFDGQVLRPARVVVAQPGHAAPQGRSGQSHQA